MSSFLLLLPVSRSNNAKPQRELGDLARESAPEQRVARYTGKLARAHQQRYLGQLLCCRLCCCCCCCFLCCRTEWQLRAPLISSAHLVRRAEPKIKVKEGQSVRRIGSTKICTSCASTAQIRSFYFSQFALSVFLCPTTTCCFASYFSRPSH